jgi:hypothetical protein
MNSLADQFDRQKQYFASGITQDAIDRFVGELRFGGGAVNLSSILIIIIIMSVPKSRVI